MKLEYQVAAVGFDQLRRNMRTVDEEARRLAVQAERRELAAAKRKDSTAKAQARARTSDAQKAARAQARVEQVQVREAEKQDRYWRAQHAKSQRDRLRAYDRENATRLQNERRADALRLRDTRRSEALKLRETRLTARRLEREEARSLRDRRSTASRITRGAGRVVGGVAGAVGTGLKVLGGAAAIGGGIAATNAVSTQMDEAAMASRLANQANQPGIKGQLLKESQGIKGFTGGEALSGLTSFTDLTGDLDTARKLLPELAKLALATGTSLDDAAAAAGNFSNTLSDIKDPAKRAEAVMGAMRALGGQGQKGAIELKNLAGGGATLAAVASQMGGDRVNAIKSAGVLAQAARSGGGADSAEEALTATARFADAVVNNASKLEAMGVKAVNRDKSGAITSIKDPREWLADFLAKSKGDLGKINDIFDIRGGKVVRGFADQYRKGGKAGVNAEFDRLLKTELGQGQINANAASRYQDTDVQFKEAMKNFNAAIGEKLLPELTKLIPKFAELTPKLADLADKAIALGNWFADNPIKGFGAILGALIAKEVAAAALSSVISSGVEKLLAIMAGKAAGGSMAEAASQTAGGWLAKAGAGGVASTVGTIGAAGAVAFGGAYLLGQAIESTDWAKKKREEEIAREMATEKRDKEFRSNNALTVGGFDQGAASRIQGSLGIQPQQAGNQAPIDMSKIEKALGDAAAKQERAAAQLSQAASALAQGNKFNPIVRIGG